MSLRTRNNSGRFRIPQMKSTFKFGWVGIGPAVLCAWLCGSVSARRAVSTAPTMRREARLVCRTSRRIVILLDADLHDHLGRLDTSNRAKVKKDFNGAWHVGG